MKQRKEKQWEKLMKPKTGSLKGSIKLIKKKKKEKKTARQTTKEKLFGEEETSFQILQKLKG